MEELEAIFGSLRVQDASRIASTGSDEVPVITPLVSLHVVPEFLGFHRRDREVLEDDDWPRIRKLAADVLEDIVERRSVVSVTDFPPQFLVERIDRFLYTDRLLEDL
ncbi:hypothetical protein [Natrinema salsiterrestre]|uniref:Uncharacterized protein n=1 Tax=Natrinema salsiterrestre TaxID=2950540 RepID=A0A9Q4Q1F2_9EURY|nr:hypothetical protein [Natrinema salsiterrestre]MDF9747945.1 hypothetical protein [Natrinema salsiterrestre]